MRNPREAGESQVACRGRFTRHARDNVIDVKRRFLAEL